MFDRRFISEDDGLSDYEYEDETSSYVSDGTTSAITIEDDEIRSKIHDLTLGNLNDAITVEDGDIRSKVCDPALDVKKRLHGFENDLDAAIRNVKAKSNKKRKSKCDRKLETRKRRFVKIICYCYLDGHKHLLEDTAKRLGIDFMNGFLQEIARIESCGQLIITTTKRKKLRLNVRAVMDVIKTQYSEKYDNIVAFARAIQKQWFEQKREMVQKRKVDTDVHNQTCAKRHKHYFRCKALQDDQPHDAEIIS